MKNNFKALILVITLLPRNFAVADVLVQPGYDQPHARIAYPSYQHIQQGISDPSSNLYKYYWPLHQQLRGAYPAQHNQALGFPLINYPYHFAPRFPSRYITPPRHLHFAKVGGLKIYEPSWYLDNRVANPLAVQARYRRSANEPPSPETAGKSYHMAANSPLIHSASIDKNTEMRPSNNYGPIYTYPNLYPAYNEHPAAKKIDHATIAKNPKESQNKENVDENSNLKGNSVQQLNSTNSTEEKKIAQRQISYEPNAALSSVHAQSTNKASENEFTGAAPSELQLQKFMDPRSYKIYHTVPLSAFYGQKRPASPDKFSERRYAAIGTMANENSVTLSENVYAEATSPSHNYYYDYYKYLPYRSNYTPYSVQSDLAHLVYQNIYGYGNNAETLPVISGHAPLTQYHQLSYQTHETQDVGNTPPATQYFVQPQSYNYAQKYNAPSSYWSSPYSTFYVKSPNTGTPRMPYVPLHV